MKKYAILIISLISLLTSNISVADKIVAIVDDSPITSSEVQNLKKLLIYFDAIDKSKDEKFISKMVLDTAISDKVIANYAEKAKMNASDQEIDAIIEGMAKSKNITKKELIRHLTKTLNIPEKYFRFKLSIESLRGKIVREVLSRDIDITMQDVESLALSTNFRDATLDLQIITAKDNGQKFFKKMENLRGKIKNCRQAKRASYKRFADMTEMTTRLSKLSPDMQALVRELPIGAPSNVIEDGKLRIVMVCDRIIDDISHQENFNLSNLIGNKKLQVAAQKFLQDLRKKAYVKIIE